jgi:beta-lactam-binding protein with PASTA domain
VSFIKSALTALKRVLIVVGIAIAFGVGLLGAIYLSLRSSATTVPDIVGKDRLSAENTISSAGLNFRVRATRPASDAKPDTVLIQLPHAGEIVKVGQTVAVDISRSSKEGETPTSSNANDNSNSEKKPENSNTNTNSNTSNDNKPKRKPANKNANDNVNGNTNRAANRNRNRNTKGNTNRNTNENVNAKPATTPTHNLNSNNPVKGGGNSNRRPPSSVPTPP